MKSEHSIAKRVITVVIAFILGLILAFCLIEVFSVNVQVLHSTGIIRSNMEVYWDSSCTNETTAVNWGTLIPSGTKTVEFYIKNNKNETMTSMTITSDHWNPSQAQSFMTLTNNYTSQFITSNSIMPLSLTLFISDSITSITDYSFNIIITGYW